jgi:hypothetical protein
MACHDNQTLKLVFGCSQFLFEFFNGYVCNIPEFLTLKDEIFPFTVTADVEYVHPHLFEKILEIASVCRHRL